MELSLLFTHVAVLVDVLLSSKVAAAVAAAAAAMPGRTDAYRQLGHVDEALSLSTDIHESSKALDGHLQSNGVGWFRDCHCPRSRSTAAGNSLCLPRGPQRSHWAECWTVNAAGRVLPAAEGQEQHPTLQLPQSQVAWL